MYSKMCENGVFTGDDRKKTNDLILYVLLAYYRISLKKIPIDLFAGQQIT